MMRVFLPSNQSGIFQAYEWKEYIPFAIDEIVEHEENFYKAKAANTGNEPPNATYWDPFVFPAANTVFTVYFKKLKMKRNWLPNTYYFVKDIIRRPGGLYKCKNDHLSGATFDSTQWFKIPYDLGVIFINDLSRVLAEVSALTLPSDLILPPYIGSSSIDVWFKRKTSKSWGAVLIANSISWVRWTSPG